LEIVIVLAPPTRHGADHRYTEDQTLPDVLKRRQAWFDGQLDLDPDRLVFIDET
jgi:hypothetical protein